MGIKLGYLILTKKETYALKRLDLQELIEASGKVLKLKIAENF